MTPEKFVAEYRKHGSVKAVMRAHGMTWRNASNAYHAAVTAGLMKAQPVGRKSREATLDPLPPIVVGEIRPKAAREFPLPAKGVVKRYLFTCAQNNTKLHEGLWENLQALVAAGYELHVSRFAYIRAGLGASGDKAGNFQTAGGKQEPWWDPRLTPFLSDERAIVAPGLAWCGEMNILPTAVRPLSDLAVYTARRSGIFPHVKCAMESVASARGEPTKFNYTTGAVTQRNYIQRKAGLKAEFHHVYGAFLAEVDSEGNWWCRQLNADSDGTIYDFDMKVEKGIRTFGHRPEAISWGDVHVAEKDPVVFEAQWGKGGILDRLRPKHQFLHDVLHWRGRSHHEMKNPHKMFLRHVQGVADVREEVVDVATFMRFQWRAWCESVVVDSNHHHHPARWLQETDGRLDPLNVEFWLAMQKRCYECIRAGKTPNYLLEALKEVSPASIWTVCAKFLAEDESFIVCPDAHGGIECGLHGDVGPNGSRGNRFSFAKMGRRTNRGHEHSASIVDGIYTAGTSGLLEPDWTRGPSSWSHTYTLTYPNGKRAQITIWKGKDRAAPEETIMSGD